MPENDGLPYVQKPEPPEPDDRDGRQSPRRMAGGRTDDEGKEGDMPARDVPPSSEGTTDALGAGGGAAVTMPLGMTPSSPPLDEAEALYQQGMSHYQRREWAQALDYFTRLSRLEPGRPGLDALLDEVRWFLQLEAIGPQGPAPAEDASLPAGRRASRWGLIFLAVLGVVLLAVAIVGSNLWPSLMGGRSQARVRELYSVGQSSLAVGDYEAAKKAFQEILTLAPGDPQAEAGLRRAESLQRLAQRYQEAREAMAQGDWDTAAERLAALRAEEPNYRDAASLAGEVARQQRLAALYEEAMGLYDQGRWEETIAKLEEIRSLDATYRAEAVQEHLFASYLSDGREKLARAGTSTRLIGQAIERFGSALSLRPFNRQASEERRLATLYLDAVQAFNNQDWERARTRLEAVRSERADYAGGQATLLLYQAYLGLADGALRAGNAGQAKTFYALASGLPVPDRSAAEEGLAKVAIALATATPTPTSTPMAIVRAAALNVRQGPGLNFPVIGVLQRDDRVAVLGRTPGGDWLLICCLAEGESGWAAASLLEASPPATALPVVSALPPTPTPRPTSTPTPSPTPVPPTSTPLPPTHAPTPRPTDTPPPPPTDTPTPVPTPTPPPPPTPTPTPPPR